MTTKRYVTEDGFRSVLYVGTAPMISTQENGEWSIEWAEDDDMWSSYLMAREIIENYVVTHNELVKLKATVDAVKELLFDVSTNQRLAELLAENERLRNLVDMAILENSRLNGLDYRGEDGS